MATFTPRTVEGPGRATPFMNVSDRQFWKHYRAPQVGVTLYKLSGGTYTETAPANLEGVVVTYLGGVSHTITDAEATLLTTAGYGAQIT